jgi:lipopolysaccharide/colanic/teichoic acid biosynthesis glycosyltransferase
MMRGGRGTPAIKRLFDVAIALTGLTIGFPILCLIGIAIALENRGPVLYTQVRSGLNLRPFRMYKFRSMVVDAERHTGAVWAAETDPRVTRVGSVLRRTHLDETPQLINVLRGEMSIVGPRPERPAIVERLTASIPAYAKRCVVRPGITGLAQVRNGYDRSLETVRRKVRYDLHYIRRSGCLHLDLAIMAETLVVVFRGVLGGPKPPFSASQRRLTGEKA